MIKKLALWWWNFKHGGWQYVFMWLVTLLAVAAIVWGLYRFADLLLTLRECCCG